MPKSNAERQKEYREHKAREKAQGGIQPAVGEPGGAGLTAGVGDEPEETLTVSVNTPEPEKTSLSIKERLFGQKQGIQPIKKPAARSGAKSKKRIDFVSVLLPTMLAGLMVTFVRDKLPEEYQPCAPTQQEASAILRPLFEEIARYVEVTGKLSETAINLTNCVIAMIAYGARSYTTYVEIKHDIAKGKRHEDRTTSTNSSSNAAAVASDYNDGYRGNQGPVSGIDGAGDNGNVGGNERGYAGDDSSNGAAIPDGNAGGELSDAAKVANMFKRDRDGRVKLGLLAS